MLPCLKGDHFLQEGENPIEHDKKVRNLMMFPKIPVGGRLTHFLPEWEKITQEKWVLSVIKEGYKLEFLQKPPFQGIKSTQTNKKNADLLKAEINSLIEKNAIEIVPRLETQSGFYSTLFLVKKKSGKMRPVINLRPLNRYLRKQHFKMETMTKVLNLVKQGDWSFSLDLSDAYLHIPIFPKTSKISSVLCAGSSVSIQSSLFRSNKRTTGVYQDNISGGSLLKKTRHKNGNLFRRLVHSEPTEKNACPRSGGNDQSPCSTRFHYQCRKIRVNSNSRNNIHRGLVQTKTRLRVSNSRTFAESKNCNYKVNTRSDISTSLSQNSGVNCIMSRTHSKQQTIHETNTNACFTSLEPIENEFRFSNSLYTRSKMPSSMVVEHKKHHERQTINSEPNMGNSYDRCIKNRLGRPFEQQNNSGDLVKQIQEQPHKQSGVGSSVSNNQTFLSSSNAQTFDHTTQQLYNTSTNEGGQSQ